MKKGKAERTAARKYINFIQELQNNTVQQRKAEKISNIMEQIQSDDNSMSVQKFWKLKKTISPRDSSKSSVLVGNTEVYIQ